MTWYRALLSEKAEYQEYTERFRLVVIQLDLDSDEWEQRRVAALELSKSEPYTTWRDVYDRLWREALQAASL